MGVIRKKTAARGGEGGVKYVCDVCSADITSTVRIATPKCPSPPRILIRESVPRVCAARSDRDVDVGFTMLRTQAYNVALNRFESDALIVPATNTTFAFNVLPTDRRVMRTSPRAIRTELSSRTRSQYSTKNGAPTRRCSL